MGVAVLIWTGLRGLALLPFLSVVVYAIGLVTTFAVSASYHRSVQARHREILRRLDQAFIFIMIAATYTPFAVISLGVAGRWLLAGVWAMAAIGVALKLMMPRRLERVGILVYLSQGWMGLLAIEPLVAALAGRNARAARRGRPALHHRRCVPPVAAVDLPEFDLASLRRKRRSLPLRRHPHGRVRCHLIAPGALSLLDVGGRCSGRVVGDPYAAPLITSKPRCASPMVLVTARSTAGTERSPGASS